MSSVRLQPPRAVVFDLFGTLVSWPDGSPHTLAMAEQLGIPYESFRPVWSRMRRARDAGEMTSERSLRIVCDELKVTADDERLRFAALARTVFLRSVLVPRAGALEALRELRSGRLRIGVLSDASLEVPMLWNDSALAPLIDAAVFSCTERTVKPDPRLYAAVVKRLGVAPSRCLYVGNGDGDELAGALRAGMRAVLFTGSGEVPGGEATTWDGPRISRLADVIGAVQSPS